MATARKLASGSWRCQVYSHTEEIIQPDGSVKQKRFYKSFTCDVPGAKGKRMAEKMAAEWAAEKEKRTAIVETMTFAQALTEYLNSKENVLSPTTYKDYLSKQRLAYDSLNDIKLCNLDSVKVQRWINQYSINHAPKTVRNAYGLLTAAVSFHYPAFKLDPVPNLPMPEKPKLYIPSDSDIKQLIHVLKDDEVKIAVYLGAFCGMRLGEICALESSDVSGNTITINKSLALCKDGTYKIKTPKTETSYRTVQAPDFVIQALSNINGRFIHCKPYNITKTMQRTLKANNMPLFRFHDLRHYYASILHVIGIPDQYIMRYGGWKTDFVMKTVYRNVIDEEAKKMSSKITGHFTELSKK